MPTDTNLLAPYRQALIGRKVGHVWRGYGSALFLEFGALSVKTRTDGSPGEPTGELSAMIEWSWRIEDAEAIICGSWSKEALWPQALGQLIGRDVVDVTAFGRLPELLVSLSGDLHVASFMTVEGDPEWALIDHRPDGLRTIHVRSGAIVEEDRRRPRRPH
jgi:hypothetical protein